MPTTPFNTSNELKLDLKRHPIDSKFFEIRVSRFYDIFKVKDGTTTGKDIRYIAEYVDFDALTTMLDDSLVTRNPYPNTFITGLRIEYGAVFEGEEADIVFIYYPVYAEQVYDSASNPTELFNFFRPTTNPDENIYKYDPVAGVFQPISAADALGYVNTYRNSIGILRYDSAGSTLCSIKNLLKTYGDAMGCFISCQEINTLYQDYNSGHPSPIEYLLFASTTVCDYINYPGKGMYRHSVEVAAPEPEPEERSMDFRTRSSNNANSVIKSFYSEFISKYVNENSVDMPISEDKLIQLLMYMDRSGGGFVNKAANMSNLCPPNCKSIRIVNREII